MVFSPSSANSSSSSLPSNNNNTNGVKLNPNFKYIPVPPNFFVRTVDMNVNILSSDSQQSSATDGTSASTTNEQNGTINNEEILESEFEPFDMPLPVPPNSKLYRDLQNSSPMKQPVVYYRMKEEGSQPMKKRSSNASNTSQGTMRRESTESSTVFNGTNNDNTEVIDEYGSDDGSDASDTVEEEEAESVWVPYEVEGRPTLGDQEEMPFNCLQFSFFVHTILTVFSGKFTLSFKRICI